MCQVNDNPGRLYPCILSLSALDDLTPTPQYPTLTLTQTLTLLTRTLTRTPGVTSTCDRASCSSVGQVSLRVMVGSTGMIRVRIRDSALAPDFRVDNIWAFSYLYPALALWYP